MLDTMFEWSTANDIQQIGWLIERFRAVGEHSPELTQEQRNLIDTVRLQGKQLIEDIITFVDTLDVVSRTKFAIALQDRGVTRQGEYIPLT